MPGSQFPLLADAREDKHTDQPADSSDERRETRNVLTFVNQPHRACREDNSEYEGKHLAEHFTAYSGFDNLALDRLPMGRLFLDQGHEMLSQTRDYPIVLLEDQRRRKRARKMLGSEEWDGPSHCLLEGSVLLTQRRICGWVWRGFRSLGLRGFVRLYGCCPLRLHPLARVIRSLATGFSLVMLGFRDLPLQRLHLSLHGLHMLSVQILNLVLQDLHMVRG